MSNAEKKETASYSTGHRILTIIGIVLCVILIPIIIINCTLMVQQLTNKDKIPSIGGVFPMIVLTDSMKGTFDSGSLVICQTTDPEDVEEGDIICFYDPTGNGTSTITHRVVSIETNEDGSLSFITKGDANSAEDSTPVPESKLLGVYKFHINGLGSLAMFMQTTPGLILFVALPILLLVGYDAVRRRLYEKKKDDDTEALVAELEALKAEKAARENVEDIENTEGAEKAESIENTEGVENTDSMESAEGMKSAEDMENIESVEKTTSIEYIEGAESAEDMEKPEGAEKSESTESAAGAENADGIGDTDGMKSAEGTEDIENIEKMLSSSADAFISSQIDNESDNNTNNT